MRILRLIKLRLGISVLIAAGLGAAAVIFFLGRNLILGTASDGPRSQAGLVYEVFSGYKKYLHPTLGFTVEFPDELEVEEYSEEEGAETIVFYHPQNNAVQEPEKKLGFQIFITPLSGEIKLTRERILEDLPEAVIDDPLRVIVNPSAPPESRVEGLLFWSASQGIGKTRELWFSRGDYLYEITTYAHLDEWLSHIVKSWRFQSN